MVIDQKDAFLSKSHSIAGISAILGDNNHLSVKAVLNILIADLVKFLNVGKNMSSGQIVETASLIVKHYGHLKPEDFKLCFENIRMGVYGALYDRMDGQALLTCLKTYDEERDYIAAEIASNNNEVHKSSLVKLLGPAENEITDEKKREIFNRNIEQLKSTLAKNKIGREREKVEKPAERPYNAIYEMHQNWLKQYDAIWKRQRYPRRIARYGMIKNPFYRPGKDEPEMIKRTFDKSEFLEYKQWQYSQLPEWRARHATA